MAGAAVGGRDGADPPRHGRRSAGNAARNPVSATTVVGMAGWSAALV